MVIDKSKTYDIYQWLADKLWLTKFEFGYIPPNNSCGKIIHISIDLIYVVELDNGKQIIIDPQGIRLVKDYRNTFVLVNNEDEYNKAVTFYEKNWFNIWYQVSVFPYYKGIGYIRTHNMDLVQWAKRHIGGQYTKWYTDITDEVLGKPQAPAQCRIDRAIATPKFKTGDLVELTEWWFWKRKWNRFTIEATNIKWKNIYYKRAWRKSSWIPENRLKLVSKDTGWLEKYVPIIEDTTQRAYRSTPTVTNPFYKLKNNKPMTTLQQEIFDRFLKSTKTKVIEATEKAEDNIEKIKNLLHPFKGQVSQTELIKAGLADWFNTQDKQKIKDNLKELQDLNKFFEDDLVKQLETILKAINKNLSK